MQSYLTRKISHHIAKYTKIEKVTENVRGGALESNGSPSSTSPSPPPSTKHMVVLEIEIPLSDSKLTSDDQAMLHEAPSVLLAHGEGGDYPPLQSFQDVKTLFHIESVQLWAIAAPIAFNILCNYGINSFTSIFVGHIGDLELSAISISLSVIANLSFGFLVSSPFCLACHSVLFCDQAQTTLIFILIIFSCFSFFVSCMLSNSSTIKLKKHSNAIYFFFCFFVVGLTAWYG